jgi:hypothetical protein
LSLSFIFGDRGCIKYRDTKVGESTPPARNRN